ncbi:hypothetical protein [Nesterenkonia sphaerica]|uniref:hypothetical protein n=1 Tax=Nesterenkonia sphaerica TaxID=1804988 RepID=UPI00140A6AE7|nr:hypothetical protein [Nesterenkonia sphaerica]
MFKRPKITAADLTEEDPLYSSLPTDDELQDLNRRIDALDERLDRLKELMQR